jgi:MFS family permease
MAQICLALFVPLYAQGVLGASATVSGTVMLPLLGAMLVSNLAAGFAIAHMGRYKVFAIAGFGSATVGFVALTLLGPTSPILLLGICLAVIGLGTGMIFPTLTLSYQSAVPFHELGVATALNQFCRSIGSTLGSALFGSLLISRFLPSVQASLPADIASWLEGPGGASIRDPQSLLNPSAAEAVRLAVTSAFPADPVAPDAVLSAIRFGLAESINWVFAAAALVSLGGLLGSLLWREIPMRRGSRP